MHRLSIWSWVLLSAAACGASGNSVASAPAAAGAQAPDGFVIKQVDAGTAQAPVRGPCDSSYRALARMVFVRAGCVDGTCHTTPGPDTPAAGLDLTEEDAFGALIDVPARALLRAPLMRVKPGAAKESLLYLKLAAARPGGPPLPEGGGGPMPIDRPPVSAEALATLAAWIDAGAPETGVVPGSEAMVADCAAGQ